METEATMADDRLRSDEGAGAWVTTSPFIQRPEEVLDVDAILVAGANTRMGMRGRVSVGQSR